MRVFGSVARGQDNDASDIDLLVDLDDGVGLVSLAAMGRELSELLGAKVDVVPVAMIKPSIRDDVVNEAIAL